MSYIDTHCHLLMKQFDDDRDTVIDQINENLDYYIEIGINIESSIKVLNFVQKEEKAYGVVGIHPTESEGIKKEDIDYLANLTNNKKIVAIGEIGLDFHWDTNRKDQFKSFDEQINLAVELDLPVVLHIREAYEEAYNFLKSKNLPEKMGVIHCFSGDWEIAKKFLDLGLYLGFDGPITYPKNNELRKVVENSPIDRILPETDSPFLPPVPFRGKRNNPSLVKYVYEKISEIKGIEEEELKDILKKNAGDLFSINC
ncbi:TatD family hydrolase [Petrotoga sp. 9PW.55.5.1]|uniref:TatD family hydrolase n=1 Tax=Petrotoga sp. 9PW.55.5.1 TaxID=1308979 RepID=UPI000DD96282|nr:TatD family hydrolase [Petrotoga sp. 9PW.55.5.1]